MLLLVLLTVVAGTQGSGCPAPHSIPEFRLEEYFGQWYTQFALFPRLNGGRCVGAEYGPDEGEPSHVTVHNVQTLANGTVTEAFGYAFVTDPAVPGQLTVQFPERPPSQLLILYTDYSTVAVLYSCEPFGDDVFEFAWINSREKIVDPETIEEAKLLLSEETGIDTSLMVGILHPDDCDYGYGLEKL